MDVWGFCFWGEVLSEFAIFGILFGPWLSYQSSLGTVFWVLDPYFLFNFRHLLPGCLLWASDFKGATWGDPQHTLSDTLGLSGFLINKLPQGKESKGEAQTEAPLWLVYQLSCMGSAPPWNGKWAAYTMQQHWEVERLVGVYGARGGVPQLYLLA